MNVLFIFLTLLIDPGKIGEVNKAKAKAGDAFARGEYKEATAQYRTLIDSMGVREEEVAMNLAHSYYHMNDTANARNTYMGLAGSANGDYRSVSFQQLGMMAHRERKLDEALANFKSALKANPYNEDARQNYEMLKRKLEEKRKEEEEQKRNQNIKPSEFARKLKAQADALVRQQKYFEAYTLMSEGLKIDKTVQHYSEFIKRTKDVSEIK